MGLATRVAVVYAGMAGIWIVFSDRVVEALGASWLQTYKGLAFVGLTTLALYVYVRRQTTRQQLRENALHDALASRQRIIAAVGHDLRQPLQSIALLATALEGQELPPKAARAAATIRVSVERMGELLRTILDLARADVGDHKIERRVFPLQDLLEAIADEMHARAEIKGMRLRWVDTGCKVESDPVLLLSILRSLVDNAIRHSNGGRILVGCRRNGASVRLLVCDSGIGIGPDHLGRIFEEFYQIDNDARTPELGLGLGLAITSRICRLLHHELAVRSVPGRGATFSVELPRR